MHHLDIIFCIIYIHYISCIHNDNCSKQWLLLFIWTGSMLCLSNSPYIIKCFSLWLIHLVFFFLVFIRTLLLSMMVQKLPIPALDLRWGSSPSATHLPLRFNRYRLHSYFVCVFTSLPTHKYLWSVVRYLYLTPDSSPDAVAITLMTKCTSVDSFSADPQYVQLTYFSFSGFDGT